MTLAVFRARTALGLHLRRLEAWQRELSLQPLERLGRWAPTLHVRDLARELEVDVAHAAEQRQDRADDLDEERGGDLLLHPGADPLEVGRVGRGDRRLGERNHRASPVQ
ncbi:MAG: hypothetical protein IPG04_25190 [Polyangiaceae bacterium]|nr:hypothetical protein [Polyangiaceae bacterium]